MDSVIVRMRFYQEIASLFGSPTPEVSERLAKGTFVDELIELGFLQPCASIFVDELEEATCLVDFQTPQEDIFTLYTTSFEVPNPPVSLSENGHRFEAISKLFEELYRVYEYFGLNFEQGTIKERPDVLTVELDFMQYLIYLESHQQDDVAPLRKAQRDFLDRHLSHFVDSLVNKLKGINLSPYQELGLLLKAFVSAEKRYLSEFRDPKYLGGMIQTVQIDNTSTSVYIP
ncbi:MAG: molecular chaperone TorD family protein [Pseudomonadales bacterium]|nr:molecular chaperone TorD family protein [Pseudomonadales bacterium]